MRTECSIGDALTMIAPVTGNGMSMAFESAAIAVEPLAAYSRGEIRWTQAVQAIADACDARFNRRLAWSKWLHWILFSSMVQSVTASIALRSNLLWHVIFNRTRQKS